MMSDFVGEITKQIRVTPARSMRCTRYSETARGRSFGPSQRIPTGRSSFENARGWIRLPRPAAGRIPQRALMHSPQAGRSTVFLGIETYVPQAHVHARPFRCDAVLLHS